MTTEHYPLDVVLFALAAGTLDETQRVEIATHVRGCASCRAFVRAMEDVGGIVLDGLPPTSLAPRSLPEVLARLEQPAPVSRPATGAGRWDRAGDPGPRRDARRHWFRRWGGSVPDRLRNGLARGDADPGRAKR